MILAPKGVKPRVSKMGEIDDLAYQGGLESNNIQANFLSNQL